MKKQVFFLVLLLGSFSIYAEGVELECSPSNLTCVNCPEYKTIFPIEEFSKSTTSLDIEADSSEIFEENYYLNGNVKASFGTFNKCFINVYFFSKCQHNEQTDETIENNAADHR